MTLGEKIKAARKRKGMTQSDLAGKQITRNMLSAIESGRANPSLDTIIYLANIVNIFILTGISVTNNAMINHKKIKNMLFYAIKKEVD